MQDLIILTDKPITYDSCSKIVKNHFSKLTLLNDDKETIYMKKSKRGFELWLSPDDTLNNPECFMEDTIDKCPNKEAFLTNLGYTSKTIAADIVNLLKPLYGNMWIQSDEEDNWFGTADEFVQMYCKR